LAVGEETEKYFLGANWRKLFAVFDTGPLYEVYNEKKHVGSLDSAFVESLDIPFLFVLGGLEWEAYKVQIDSHKVFARKTKAGNAPRWQTFHGFDVPYEVANEVGRILFAKTEPSFLDKNAIDSFKSSQIQVKNLKWDCSKWVVELEDFEMKLWTFAGDKINRTLASLVNSFNLGKSSSNYKFITIKSKKSTKKLNGEDILKFLSDIKNININDSYEFQNRIKEDLRLVHFSKFTRCLPDSLIAEAMLERSFDFNNLISELQKIKIKEIN